MRWDVIVVGGGPAGSAAARTCASKGLRTLLLEKAKHPRYKPCAGGVTAAAARELEGGTQTGLPGGTPPGTSLSTSPGIPCDIVERVCREVRIIYGGAERTVSHDAPVAYTVKREVFDAYLLRLAVKSGAVVREGEEALAVERGARGVTVRTAARGEQAPLVIGADGYFSKVRKFAGYGFGADETLFCVIADVPLPEAEIAERFRDRLTIHYGLLERGYGWLFPKRDHISAGIGGEWAEPRSLPGLFRSFLAVHGLRYDGKVRGCFLPVSKTRHRSIADRVLLAGDAAGFVDAFSGEGIRFALISGRLAGATAALCHERGDFSEIALRGYEDLWYGTFGEDLLRSVRMTDLAFRRRSLFFGVALGNRTVLVRYVKTITGELRLGDLLAWVRKRMPVLLLRSILLVVKLRMGAKERTLVREGAREVRFHG